MTSGLADVSSGSLGDSHFFLALSLKVFGVLPLPVHRGSKHRPLEKPIKHVCVSLPLIFLHDCSVCCTDPHTAQKAARSLLS